MSQLIIDQANANKAGFAQAYAQKKISLADYTKAVNFENQKIAEQQSLMQQQKQQAPPAPTGLEGSSMGLGVALSQQAQAAASTPVLPAPAPEAPAKTTVPNTGLPTDPQTTVYVGSGGDEGLYLRSDYEVVDKKVTETPQGAQTTYTFAPKEQPKPVVPQPPTPNVAGFAGAELNVSDIFGVKPIVDTNEKRTAALEIVTAVVAPAVGGAGILAGEAIGAGLSQIPNAVKAAKGEQVTIKDVAKAGLEGAALGGVLSVGGGAIIEGIGATGKTAASTITRVGVNTGLGAVTSAGVEKATTGEITLQTVAEGAAFGAAFGAAGELAGLGSQAVKASKTGKAVQEKVSRSVYSVDENMVKNGPDLTLKEKAIAKAAGIKPEKPALNTIELPTIPTAPKDAMTTYKGFETKEVETRLPVSNVKGKIVDEVVFKDIVTKPRDFITEKTTPESMGITPKQSGSAVAADMLDARSVLVGRSVEPSEYYNPGATPKEAVSKLPEYRFNKNTIEEVPTEKGPLSFKKTNQEIIEQRMKIDTSKTTSLNPSKMVAERTKAFEHAGSPKDLATYPEYDIKKIGNIEAPIKGMEGLKKEINRFEKLPKGDRAQDKAIADAQKYRVPERSKGEFFTETTTKGKSSDQKLIQEMTKGEAAKATGIEKVLSDVKTGRAIETGKAKIAPIARNVAVANPFQGYTGASYYKRKAIVEDIDVTFITRPGEVSRLNPDSSVSQIQRDNAGTKTPSLPVVSPIDVPSQIQNPSEPPKPIIPIQPVMPDQPITPKPIIPIRPIPVNPIVPVVTPSRPIIPIHPVKPIQPVINDQTIIPVEETKASSVTKPIPIQKIKTPLEAPTFSKPKSTTKGKSWLNLPVGGGAGGGGLAGSGVGSWRKQNNPVKTYDKMLRDFGVNTKASRQSMKTKSVKVTPTRFSNPYMNRNLKLTPVRSRRR